MIGRVDMLSQVQAILTNWKHEHIDLSPILYAPENFLDAAALCQRKAAQSAGHDAGRTVSGTLAQPAFEGKQTVVASLAIHNINRAAGTILGSELTRKFGSEGMKDHSIHIDFEGSAGQSFGAFMSKGITFSLSGDCNDYMGKGLSGGILCITAAGREAPSCRKKT